MASSSSIFAFTLLLVVLSVCNVESQQLQSNYYALSCPGAQSAIRRIVTKAVRDDARVGAGMIRLLFHDCFVQGCDASILIDDPNGQAEKNSIPNLTLHDFDLIDQAKSAVEAICPKTVSCADIIATAASTSLFELGGPTVDLKGGRFDGKISNSSEALTHVPSPFANLTTLQSQFTALGLDNTDLVALSGAHSVGKAHCAAFSGRLRNFSSTDNVDPTLNPRLAKSLQKKCPVNPPSTTLVKMDRTPAIFDNKYFKAVQSGRGLFSSDAELYSSADTKSIVDDFVDSKFDFSLKFSKAISKMGQAGLKTAANGNIRTNCRSFT